MNDEEISQDIPNEEPPKPKRVRPPKALETPVYDDPYADDFEWNPDVGTVAEPVNEVSYIDPYAEPSIEKMTDQAIERTQPFYAAEPLEPQPFEDREPTPLFQPDLVPNFVPEPFEPDTTAETVRRSGLAYSIGIVFVVSVAFMLLLGWIADWMFGTKPWGLVGGIVFGSIIGFVQVIRISSRIFTPDKNSPAISPLMSHAADNEQIEPIQRPDPVESTDTD